MLPEELPWEEGRDTPPGYHIETRASKGAVITGSVLFGSAYVISILAAATIIAGGDRYASGYGPLFIPVIGPFITLGTGRDTSFSRNDGAPGALLVIFDGIAQSTGLIVLIAGAAAEKKVFVRGEWQDKNKASKLTKPEIHVGPMGGTAKWVF